MSLRLRPVQLSRRHFGEEGACLSGHGLAALAAGERVDARVVGPSVDTVRPVVLCRHGDRLLYAATGTGSLFDAESGLGWRGSMLRLVFDAED